MYVQRRYTASSELTEDRTFWCLHCDFKCPALSFGIGSASTTSGGFGYSEGATVAAVQAAQAAAQALAKQSFGLIPCPRCGKTDTTAVHRFRVGAAARAIFAGVVCGFVGYIVVDWSYPITHKIPNIAGVGMGFAAGVVLAILERVIALFTLRGRTKLFPEHAPSNDLTRL